MYQPLISIIVPIYKVEEYLNQCINSIVNQTYKNLEIILIDDGSPDNCPQICDDWCKKDSRIKVIHRINGGLSAARNSGIDVAIGDYLFLVDSDDFLDLNCLECLANKLTTNELDIVITNPIQYINNTNQHVMYNQQNIMGLINHDDAIEGMLTLTSCSWNAWGKLYKSNLFKGVRFPEGQNYEDLFLIPIIFDKATKIYLTPTHKYYYRMRENSIVNAPKTIKNLFDYWLAAQKTFDYFKNSDTKIKNAVIFNNAVRLIDILYAFYDSNLISNNYSFYEEVLYYLKKRRKLILNNPLADLHIKLCYTASLLSPFCMYIIQKLFTLRKVLKNKIAKFNKIIHI